MNAEETRHLIKALINKATAIPARDWCSGSFDDHHGRHCFLGHLVVATETILPPLASQAVELFDGNMLDITAINDGDDDGYHQRGPRARILAALHDKLKECL